MKKILGVLILLFIIITSCTTKYKNMNSFETVKRMDIDFAEVMKLLRAHGSD